MHPVLPLALLEAVRGLDLPNPDAFPEFHDDLSSKRLGMSRTVATQIDRFTRMMKSGRSVEADELVALLRLVGRRNDASLVFSEAGRRAGRLAVQRTRTPLTPLRHVLPGGLRTSAGFRLAQRTVRSVLGGMLRRTDGVADASLEDPPSARATEGGAACSFYGAALAEVLRLLTDFEGAMFHVACRTKGDAACVWRAAPESLREETV